MVENSWALWTIWDYGEEQYRTVLENSCAGEQLGTVVNNMVLQWRTVGHCGGEQYSTAVENSMALWWRTIWHYGEKQYRTVVGNTMALWWRTIQHISKVQYRTVVETSMALWWRTIWHYGGEQYSNLVESSTALWWRGKEKYGWHGFFLLAILQWGPIRTWRLEQWPVRRPVRDGHRLHCLISGGFHTWKKHLWKDI